MNELVMLVQNLALSVSRYYYVLGLILLGAVIVDRGRRAAATERMEDAREREAA